MLLTVSVTSFSQPTNVQPRFTKTDYLKKSKHQKTLARIFLATGASCVLTGSLIPLGEEIKVFSGGGWFSGAPTVSSYYKNKKIKGQFVGIGILAMLTSIPFYCASDWSNQKAMRLSFKNETVPQLQNGSFKNQTVPSIALKVRL